MKATVFFDVQFAEVDWEDLFVRYTSRKQVHVENVNRKIDVQNRMDGPVHASIGAKGRSRHTTITAQRATGEEPHKLVAASLVHLNRTATFDPGLQGKVEGIDFYLDLMHVDATPGAEVHYGIVIKQDGVLFQSPPARLTGGTKKWKGFISESLVAADFIRIGKPTVVSPHTKPFFGKDAAPLQFGYIVHVAGPGSSVKSVTSIGEWKVSVAHREDLSMSLSQTLEFRQRLDSEVLERQRLERAIVEQRIKAEQELRELRLKAEEEINSLRLSLPIAERGSRIPSFEGDGKNASPASNKHLGRTDDLAQLLSGDASPHVEDKYISIVKAAQNRLLEVDSRRKAERQRKEKLEEEHENMRKTIDLERQGREEAERKWAAQYEEVAKSATEEKRQLSEELDSYRKRIFHLEQELRGECKLKDQKEEELRRLRDEVASKNDEMRVLLVEIDKQAAALAQHEAERHRLSKEAEHRAEEIALLKSKIVVLDSSLTTLEQEKRDLEKKMHTCCSLLDQREHEWSETSARKDNEAKEAQQAAEERLQAEVDTWRQRLVKLNQKHAAQEEALKDQLAQEKAQLEEELAKAIEAHERKEEAWKRTANELNTKLKTCTQDLTATAEEMERSKHELQAALTEVGQKLTTAQTEVAQRDQEAEALRQELDMLKAQLREVVVRAQEEVADLRTTAKRREEAWEQERWQVELERAEAKREAELAEERMRQMEQTLADVRQESTARARDLADADDRLVAANALIDKLNRDLRQELDDEQDARKGLEEIAGGLRAQLVAEAERNKEEMLQVSAAAAAEKAGLEEKLSAEKESRQQLAKELETLKESYELEKTLREKIARELFAEIDARKEGEKRQTSVIAALNDHMKKQAEAIVQLDYALKQEQVDRIQLEEQVEAEVMARVKAEEALRKLDEIFKNASKEEDNEWELVTDEDGKNGRQ